MIKIILTNIFIIEAEKRARKIIKANFNLKILNTNKYY